MKSIDFLDGMSLHSQVIQEYVKENYGQEIENSETFLDLLYTYIAGTGTMEHGMKITMDTNAAYNVYYCF